MVSRTQLPRHYLHPAPEAMRPLDPGKLAAIDHARRSCGMGTFADLGSMGRVFGGYSFYAMRQPGVRQGYMMDLGIDDWARSRARAFPGLEVIEEDFTTEAARSHIPGEVDAIFLFDVLLHTVQPDWDQFLETWTPLTRSFVIANPQWFEGEETIRLIDLGREGYERTVPDSGNHAELFDRLDEPFELPGCPYHGRLYRDAMHVWQWGITDRDLRAKLGELGFSMVYYARQGPFWSAPRFLNTLFIFVRE